MREDPDDEVQSLQGGEAESRSLQSILQCSAVYFTFVNPTPSTTVWTPFYFSMQVQQPSNSEKCKDMPSGFMSRMSEFVLFEKKLKVIHCQAASFFLLPLRGRTCSSKRWINRANLTPQGTELTQHLLTLSHLWPWCALNPLLFILPLRIQPWTTINTQEIQFVF